MARLTRQETDTLGGIAERARGDADFGGWLPDELRRLAERLDVELAREREAKADRQPEADDAAILGLLGEGWEANPQSYGPDAHNCLFLDGPEGCHGPTLGRLSPFYQSLLAAAHERPQLKAEVERWQRRVVELERRLRAMIAVGRDALRQAPIPAACGTCSGALPIPRDVVCKNAQCPWHGLPGSDAKLDATAGEG